MKQLQLLIILLFASEINAQDLSFGLIVNDIEDHPMQNLEKPDYLDSVIDPSFGTTIRRISNAQDGGVIVPMYSTVQAWNADESYLILYYQSGSIHWLLDGLTYQFIRELDDINAFDLEQLFWDFDDPEILYFPESGSNDFVRYNVNTGNKETVFNFEDVTSNCSGSFSLGNDVQMISWDSDVLSFRCNNERAYYYRISTAELVEFNIENINYTAPMPAPSGNNFYHLAGVYNQNGEFDLALNESNVEHSSLGKLANGNDAHFAVSFSEGPFGGCLGNLIAHDLTSGNCFPIISEDLGYAYSKSGTHISATSHKNTEGGWLAASMIGFEQDGQTLLDQELIIARAVDEENSIVCRIAHHRSDEDQFDYWGEPHPVISPSGTRVLYASDWSGIEDGNSVDSYVVELPSYTNFSTSVSTIEKQSKAKFYPNPFSEETRIKISNTSNQSYRFELFSANGKLLFTKENDNSDHFKLERNQLISGLYFYQIKFLASSQQLNGKLIIED